MLRIQVSQPRFVLVHLREDGWRYVRRHGGERGEVRDGDDEDVSAPGHARVVGVCVLAGGDDLAFGEGEVAFGADGDDEVFRDIWVGEAEPAFARLSFRMTNFYQDSGLSKNIK